MLNAALTTILLAAGLAAQAADAAERVGALERQLAALAVPPAADAEQDRLPALFAGLDIDPASQVLVFSKTSVNPAQIGPRTPRAIYFNDHTYLARVPGAGMIEIAIMDAGLGPLFFLLRESSPPAVERQTVACLRCHDSRTLSGGVPRFILGSGYVGTRGELVSHEGWILTDQQTPLKFRWGGWYVTGHHGTQPHLGNVIVEDLASLRDLDRLRVYNLESLDGMIEVEHYPVATSDIVALLVLQHQVDIHNLITRVRHDTDAGTGPAHDTSAEALVQALLFAGEAPLSGPVRSSSAFPAGFTARGPFDERGRSLRELDLRSRLFRYPVSYLVTSDAFTALPGAVLDYVYSRLDELLVADTTASAMARYDPQLRKTAREILLATSPGFAAALADRAR